MADGRQELVKLNNSTLSQPRQIIGQSNRPYPNTWTNQADLEDLLADDAKFLAKKQERKRENDDN